MSREKDRSSSEYAQNLSHELLTPLAVIRSKAELLMQSPNLNQEDLKNLDAILETVDRMSRLNKALILLSKIDNKIYTDVVQIDVNDLIANSLEKFEDQIRLKSLKIRFHKKEPVFLSSNLTLFEIMITNLIKNAVFHNVADGQISIFSESGQFIIENHTSGDVEENIYERFISQGKDENSLGLGLHIVKKICELFNFTVQHESHSGKFKMSIKY